MIGKSEFLKIWLNELFELHQFKKTTDNYYN